MAQSSAPMHTAAENGVPRRRLLGTLVGVINAVVVGAILAPTLAFVAAPMLNRKKRSGKWIDVLDEKALPEGVTRAVTYEVEVPDGYTTSRRRYSIYVSRKEGVVSALDPTCPHLGCHVEYKEPRKRFICPCHGGVFDNEGNHVSGPPPRGLDRVEAKVENGRIWIYKV